MKETIAIVGYMGCGKSTVGRIVARRLDLGFVDLDREISFNAGRSIPEIFETNGEKYFRDLEARALAAALQAPARVIACGGGIVVSAGNRRRLEDAATVFLREDLDILYTRTRGKNRPLRAGSREEFEHRYTERLPFYLEVADLEVRVARRPPKAVAEEVIRWYSGST